MDDAELAAVVAVKVLLARPENRDEVLRAEIPFDRFARVMPLIPGVMAEIFDALTAREKRVRLGMQGIMRTFLQKVRDK